MTRSCKPNIGFEVINNSLLPNGIASLFGKWSFNLLKPVVYTPEIERNMFSEVTDNEFEFRETIKDTVTD